MDCLTKARRTEITIMASRASLKTMKKICTLKTSAIVSASVYFYVASSIETHLFSVLVPRKRKKQKKFLKKKERQQSTKQKYKAKVQSKKHKEQEQKTRFNNT